MNIKMKNVGNGNQISKAMKRNLEHGEHRRDRRNVRRQIEEDLEIRDSQPVWVFDMEAV
jgi:hypothetical protein